MPSIKYNEIAKCLPDNLREDFCRMNAVAKQYTAHRIMGMTKKDALLQTGSTAVKTANQTADYLERKNPQIKEIVNYCINNSVEQRLLNPKSSFNKVIDEQVKQAKSDEALTAQVLTPEQQQQIEEIEKAPFALTPNQAESIQFYRDLCRGKYKTYKTTIVYDADDKVVSKKVEKIDDVAVKIKARQELDRLLGLNSLRQMGSVQVGKMTIKIIDTSQPTEEDNKPPVDYQNATIIDEEDVIDGGVEEIHEKKK